MTHYYHVTIIRIRSMLHFNFDLQFNRISNEVRVFVFLRIFVNSWNIIHGPITDKEYQMTHLYDVIWYSLVVVYQTGVNWCPLWWVIIGFLWVIIIFLVCNIENWKTTTSRVSRPPIGQYSGAWSEVSHQMIHNDIISMSHSF